MPLNSVKRQHRMQCAIQVIDVLVLSTAGAIVEISLRVIISPLNATP